MIKEITLDQLSVDMKHAYDNWYDYFISCIEKSSFIPFTDYKGEDKNILSFQSPEKYINWWRQPPGNEPYRDDGFYTRELTWLSEWCNPSIVVEIGTDKGMGTFLLDRLNPHAEIYTVDIADHAYMPSDRQVEIGYFSKLNECQVYYMKEKPEVRANLIFIDGDHSEASVWEDSLWAWKHIDKTKRWGIVWHDARQGNEEFLGLIKSIHRFSDHIRRKVYKFADSSTVWITGEPE